MEVAVARPQRWDQPFGDGLREVDVDHLLEVEPFCRIDPTAFPPTLPLRDLLRNDARLMLCNPGDLVVREGDYGHSAFIILRGRVRVMVAGLAGELLAPAPPAPRSWLATISPPRRA